ncbi:TRAP transporter solute receptor, TAXI family [Tepidanaerobacter acetatoxydans Re1]|uniref:TRAP transporter solute receptor, TAXI family n=1 Tax=Tepidanaerobacter acetatoxydans (strain DSM 21804 / JCM 16047 / Re1) TaxID=1209989 RepID=F4LSK0_TEPAE|nr:TAXI family TRAP transporter solute-binding subunit [Tepidanaerobacter acetatoxydans]AEE92390.1 TRAP transporter solute receptor, TAXI family [Tepidanaerobacter acetatoxydans Re1]CCP27289.1 TRAP transporter solute receptor, TAXI family [Tepidanaerobacter acetatoxydans Re1]
MKKKIALLLLIVLVFTLLAGCSKKDSSGNDSGEKTVQTVKKQYLTFAAPPASSALYPYWVSVGKAISTTYPEFQITVSESQGAVDIAKRIRSGEVIVGNCVSSTDYENYHGVGVFDGDPNEDLRILWYYETTPEQFVVSKTSGVNTVYDLNGKKFNPGGTGTSAASITFSILEFLGVSPDYFEAGQADAADAYANRQIIGTVKLGPINDSYVMQLIASQPANLINFSDEDIEKIIKEFPYLIPVTIPAGTYQGVDYDVKTIATIQGAQTTTKLTQEDGYKMIKAMWEEGKEIWQSAYTIGAQNNILELSLRSSVPLHAGTVQYLKEQGYDVPASLIPPEYKE